MNILGFIPARGGSKSIPRKNILPFVGKPLLGWTVEAALHSHVFYRTILSTDDNEIAQVGRTFGVDVPFFRPSKLATDTTTLLEVILHTLQYLQETTEVLPEAVMTLQPTSPLRSIDDILGAVRVLQSKDADSVISVSLAQHHPYWMKVVCEEGSLKDFMNVEHVSLRRQDLPDVFSLNGAIFLVKTNILLEKKTFYTNRTYPYVMPIERSIDIDTQYDFRLAEFLKTQAIL